MKKVHCNLRVTQKNWKLRKRSPKKIKVRIIQSLFNTINNNRSFLSPKSIPELGYFVIGLNVNSKIE